MAASDPGLSPSSSAHVVVSEKEERQRLDQLLGPYCRSLSRNRIQTLIKEGSITVEGRLERPGYKVRCGERINIDIPNPQPVAIEPEEIPIDIVYEDAELLVLNKAAGMTVHPAPGVWTGTLVNALLNHCSDLSGINGTLRPGIVHRLDRQTTGLMVVAKSDGAHRSLASQLQERSMDRRYTAVAWGELGKGRIDAPIGRHHRDRTKMVVRKDGREAATRYAAVAHYPFLTRLELSLESGRTHQIRVHLLHIGHPVFGDPVYGGRSQTQGIPPAHRQLATALLSLIEHQALHAHRLSFRHPSSGEPLDFQAPLPDDLSTLLKACES